MKIFPRCWCCFLSALIDFLDSKIEAVISAVWGSDNCNNDDTSVNRQLESGEVKSNEDTVNKGDGVDSKLADINTQPPSAKHIDSISPQRFS